MKEILIITAIMVGLRIAELGINRGVKVAKTTKTQWDDFLFEALDEVVKAVKGLTSKKKG